MRLRDLLPTFLRGERRILCQRVLKDGPSWGARPRKVVFSLWKGNPADKPNLLVVSRPDQDFKYVHFKGFNQFFAWSTDQGLEALRQKKDWQYILMFSTMWAPGVVYQSNNEDVLALTGAMNVAYEIGDLNPKPKLVIVWGPNVGKGRAVRDYLIGKGHKVGLMLNLKDKKVLLLPKEGKEVKIFNPADIAI